MAMAMGNYIQLPVLSEGSWLDIRVFYFLHVEVNFPRSQGVSRRVEVAFQHGGGGCPSNVLSRCGKSFPASKAISLGINAPSTIPLISIDHHESDELGFLKILNKSMAIFDALTIPSS